jgi:7-cyano-7-deazaguanine reductase
MIPPAGRISPEEFQLPSCTASVELKSLKKYLFTYRSRGIFQENVASRVLGDVVKACEPVGAVVKGEFRPRGGISRTIKGRSSTMTLAVYPKLR